jgi:hypothetical protein
MRAPLNFASLLATLLAAGCADEAATVEGLWNVDEIVYTHETTTGEGEARTTTKDKFTAKDAGTLHFERTEGSRTGIGDHTLTRHLKKIPNGTGAEPGFDEVEAANAECGWSPGGFDDDEGILDDPNKDPAVTVFDAEDRFNGVWYIRETGFLSLTLEHSWGVDFGGNASQADIITYTLSKQ